VKLALLASLNAERKARRAAVLVTELESGAQRLVRSGEIAGDELAEALTTAVAQGKSANITHDGKVYFFTVHVPPLRIIVCGAVHVSQAMVPMARQLGLDIAILDPRSAFATPERFADVRLVAKWPDEALAELGELDRYTAMVALTHDPKIDDPALIAALRADCLYIGALGSRKTHAKRLERLAAAGFGAAALARIHAPIGLDIGAVSPAEIALAILGEIIATQRKSQ
jgi:xanthine dehydrogenase accessory factor